MGVPPSGVPDDAVEVMPGALARLGRFHPEVAAAVTALADRRGVVVLEQGESDTPGEVELFVAEDDRDALRAQLVVAWDQVMSALDVDLAVELRATPGNLPGWLDAPAGVWVDRAGRFQVARAPDEEIEEDARRTLGPGISVTGALLLLLAWYVGPGDLRWSAGVAGVLLGVAGLFVPR